ncbi:MAG TPA: hypothetical protein VGQ29_06280 [Gemmatimonadales bacterium]|nr:hypothetical protein [Gemmatimonadales bacterium]
MTNPLEDLRKKLDPTPTLQDVRVAKPVVLEVVRAGHPEPVPFRTLIETVIPRCTGERFIGFPPDYHRGTSELVSLHIRWAAATVEALNELYHAGLIQPRRLQAFLIQSHVPYKAERSEGSFSYFAERDTYTEWLLTRRAVEAPDRDFLFDPDMYLERAGLSAAHKRIQTSAEQAVTAYRQELYLAAATMIGSASEGAWLEFFEAFGTWAVKTGAKAPAVDQFNLAQHVQKMVPQHKGTAGFDAIMDTAGVGDHELKTIVQHYDYLRDVRNYAAHFDPTDRFDLTYAGVGILLLEAARYFATLYKLTAALRA